MPPDPERSPLILLRPRYWAIHLLAIVATTFALGMGVWQYQSWEAKRDRETLDLTKTEAIPVLDAIGPDDPFPADQLGQPVTIKGTWLPDSTVYVETEEGYWAATPIKVEGTESAIYVVRGTTDQATGKPPTGETDLVGWLQPPQGARVSDDDPTDDVLPQLRIADAIQHVDGDLFGAYAVLDTAREATNPGTDGLTQATLAEVPGAARTTGLRNIFYSAEWIIFAGFALFVWWRWMRDEVHGRPDDEEADEDPAPE
ncbi:MAG: SURF1 family protein [Nocardioides sp.]